MNVYWFEVTMKGVGLVSLGVPAVTVMRASKIALEVSDGKIWFYHREEPKKEEQK